MTSSSPVKAYNATMGTSVESGRLLISAFMYCLESECIPAKPIPGIVVLASEVVLVLVLNF